MMPRRLAVIAGAGLLAPLVVRTALAAGDAVRVIALAELDLPADADILAGTLSRPDAVISAVRDFGASHLVLAGAVTLDDAARTHLAETLGNTAATSMGDAALSGLAGQLEHLTGARLIGAHEVVRDLLAASGSIAGPDPTEAALATARLALEAARVIGGLDLGQAAIAQGGRVIAVEDAAGTDELIERVGRYMRRGIIEGSATLVLAKASKPGQSLQIDLPAIGPQTVANAVAAKIGMIAVEAGRTLILDRPALVRAAQEASIAVFGLAADA